MVLNQIKREVVSFQLEITRFLTIVLNNIYLNELNKENKINLEIRILFFLLSDQN